MEKTTITVDEVRRRLQQQIDLNGSQTATAQRLGVSLAYLNDVIRGKREPGEKLLTPIGIQKVIIYQEVQVTPNA